MAIAIDQANAGTAVNDATGTSLAVSTSQAVASSGFIVVSVGWWDTTVTLSSVSGGGLTWAIAVQGKHPSQNWQQAIAYAQAPSGLASGTTITANFSATTPGRQIGVLSFTGVATSSPVDVTAAVNTTGASTWTTGNMTILAGSVIVATSHADGGGATTSTTTAPSIEALDWSDGANTSQTTAYRIEASAGTYAVAGTWTGTTANACVGAAFLEGAVQTAGVSGVDYSLFPKPKLRTIARSAL